VSILSAHGVRIEGISDLVSHSGTTVTETVYRHEIRPAGTPSDLLSNGRDGGFEPADSLTPRT
jgi:hypothetical protein